MSLYFSEPAGGAPGPRLHALIIGVGGYRHLDLNAAAPARILNGLMPLTCTVPAAKSIARWLATEYRNPGCPLGSVELLLSPNESLVPAGSSAPMAIEEATMANITAAFARWQQRCDADPGNIAFFYFSGHGVSGLRQFLLAEDFGNPMQLNDWENCIDFTGMKSGMRRCRAQTQVYFIDACRDTPNQMLSQLNANGKPLINAAVQDSVPVSAAYYAASEGRHAYGPDGLETYFCQALLLCLRGAAARNVAQSWRVDTANLGSSLPAVVDVLSCKFDQSLTCEVVVQKPALLHFPPDGLALLRVTCLPDKIGAQASIRVTNSGKVDVSPAGERRPWAQQIKAGPTHVEVDFNTYPREVQDPLAMPPTCEVEVVR